MNNVYPPRKYPSRLSINKLPLLPNTVLKAAAVGLKAGTDVDCGNTYLALPDALKQGLVTEADIDKGLERALTVRFRLGVYDASEPSPFSHIKVLRLFLFLH